MRPLLTKLLVGAVSTAVARAAAALYLGSRAGTSVALVDRRAAAERALLARQLEPRGLEPVVPGVDPEARIRREPLDAVRVAELFTLAGGLEHDERSYYRYPAHWQVEVALPEYPGGKVLRTTNARGEREDEETFTGPLDAFVLVAGDSHTDGVCTNPETYANRLEARLERRFPGRALEVLNTGVGGYSFYNYLGVLEKYLERAPAVFVSACYGGNDFLESLRPYHWFHRTIQPPRSPTYWDEVNRAKKFDVNALAQGLNSILYFKRHPDEVEVALEAAVEVCNEIERQCRERSVDWIFVYIPSAYDCPWPDQAAARERARSLLDLGERELDVINRLGDRLLAHLRARGVATLDLREHFDREGRWYWSELHVNLRAHERIAALLEAPVADALARRGLAADDAVGR
jgi:hypothetical protein